MSRALTDADRIEANEAEQFAEEALDVSARVGVLAAKLGEGGQDGE